MHQILRAVVALSFVFGLAAPVAASSQAQLVDQTGRTFTLQSLQGRPVVVTFVSAHCTDACPLVNAQFADAARRIQKKNLSAMLVTITLDPRNDPPSLMKKLATQFQANPKYWLFASGKPADVDAILKAFGVVAKPGKSGYREEHTTFVYVFDARGNLSKTMMASTVLNDDVVDAVRALQVAAK